VPAEPPASRPGTDSPTPWSRLIAHPDNDFYGHKRVLADYAGLGPDLPVIWGHVQHGWSEANGLSVRRRLVRWLPKLVFNDANVAAARELGIERVTVLGDPFCYLDVQARGLDAGGAPGCRSTIAYPSHGWERDEIFGSHHALADAMREREEGPVTVCLYWHDFNQPGVRDIYAAAGFRVISHGYRHDPLFTWRQHDELLRHDRVVANRAATALWRGGLLGRAIEIYGPVFSIIGSEEADAYDRMQRSRWPELFDGGVDGAVARELAGSELGRRHVRSAEELRDLLGWTPSRRRLGPLVRAAARTEHNVRRVAYNVALRLPRADPLPRF
jgi:hypothetical protein